MTALAKATPQTPEPLADTLVGLAETDPAQAVLLAAHAAAGEALAAAGLPLPSGTLALLDHPDLEGRWQDGRFHLTSPLLPVPAADTLVILFRTVDGLRVGQVPTPLATDDETFGLAAAGIRGIDPGHLSVGDSAPVPAESALAVRVQSHLYGAAINLGIAAAAIRDTNQFLHSRARPWFEAEGVAVHEEQQVRYRAGLIAVEYHRAQALFRRAQRLATLGAAVEARAAASEIALRLADELFVLNGTRATDTRDDFGRHWRNARTHSLLDDSRYLHREAGEQALRSPAADLPPRPASIRTAADALAVARHLSADIRQQSAERDRIRRNPVEELRRIAATGLFAAGIPTSEGGFAGISRGTAYQLVRILGQGDGAIGQIAMIHFSFVDQFVRNGSAAQKALFIPRILAGARFSNATAERHTEHAKVVSARLVRDGDDAFRLNGQKYYCTGSVGADWISFLALDEDGRPAVAYVPADAPGLEIQDDWDALGQRGTGSGGVRATDVRVPHELVTNFYLIQDVPSIAAGAANLGHVALDVGILEATFEDAVGLLRARGADDLLLHLLGQLSAKLHATQELFEDAVAHYERIAGTAFTDEQARRFSLEVSEAKAFIGDAAVEIGNELFALGGIGAASRRDGHDRHWRNVRTHTLHDPNRWKYYRAGDHFLNGTLPPQNRNN